MLTSLREVIPVESRPQVGSTMLRRFVPNFTFKQVFFSFELIGKSADLPIKVLFDNTTIITMKMMMMTMTAMKVFISYWHIIYD